MIVALIFLMITMVVCGTIVAVCAMAMWHNRPSKAVLARDQVEVEKARTAMEMERWRQDWLLDMRGKGGPPQLPPGTTTVETPHQSTHRDISYG